MEQLSVQGEGTDTDYVEKGLRIFQSRTSWGNRLKRLRLRRKNDNIPASCVQQGFLRQLSHYEVRRAKDTQLPNPSGVVTPVACNWMHNYLT
jgi:hypothetical protein